MNQDTARLCLFCDNESGSQEHAWPDWIRRYLMNEDGEYRIERLLPSGLVTLAATDHKEFELVVDCVCDTCNRGWMHRLEDAASPILKPMMRGEPTLLTLRQQRTLVRWASKTATVLACEHEAPVARSRAANRQLQQGGLPPFASVALSRYIGPSVLNCHNILLEATIDGDDHYVFWTTLLLGEVVMQIVAARRENNAAHFTFNQASRNLYAPLLSLDGEPLVWPPDRAMDDGTYRVMREPRGALRL